MKIIFLSLIIFAIAACSTSSQGLKQSSDSSIAIKDQRLSTNFSSDGIKITFFSNGELESIEVNGQAPAWKKNVEILAEADAMDKLVKFVYGKNVNSERRVKVISRVIDIASDVTNNKFQTVDGTLETNASDIEVDVGSSSNESDQKDNTAYRKAQVVDKTLTTAITHIKSQGFLVGVRKVSDAIKDDGRIYVATFRWSQKDMNAAINIKESMGKTQKK